MCACITTVYSLGLMPKLDCGQDKFVRYECVYGRASQNGMVSYLSMSQPQGVRAAQSAVPAHAEFTRAIARGVQTAHAAAPPRAGCSMAVV